MPGLGGEKTKGKLKTKKEFASYQTENKIHAYIGLIFGKDWLNRPYSGNTDKLKK